MGQYKDSRGISCFTPDDTEDSFYVAQGWMNGPTTLKYIHTNCLYYDQYDPGDYTNYLKITRIKEN